MKIAIFADKVIKPLEQFGLTSKFWGMHPHTIQNTWIAMAILFVLVLIARLFLKKDLNVVSVIFEQSVSFFNDLCRESFGKQFKEKYFAFVATIFFFTLSCSIVGLIPYIEESTKDLNTTLALGCLIFFYVQYQKIKIHGIGPFFKEFTEPFFVLLPLNLVGEVAKIASMAFRLFGNILGGSIIFLILVNSISIYKTWFIGFSLGGLVIYFLINKFIDLQRHKVLQFALKSLLIAIFFVAGTQMFFGIFEGAVQAFVLAMLAITYLSVAIQKEDAYVE
ncbi:F0F1 ATP synthase subunit A [Candidatus Dependentiae bacterium]